MKYPFKVVQMMNEQHIYWVATSQLDGCVGQGETMEEAISELAENETAWLETAAEVGIPIPDVAIEKAQAYSGKLTLRIAPSVHAMAAKLAKKDGISLNQYINDAVVAHNKENTILGFVSERVSGLTEWIGQKFISGASYSTNNEITCMTSLQTMHLINRPNVRS